MIDFAKAINWDAISALNAEQKQEILDMFTSSETKDALKIIEATNKSGKTLSTLSTRVLKDALEINHNSYGFYHFSNDTIYCDLIDLAEYLVGYYNKSPNKTLHDVAETLYYRCLDELDD